VGTAGAVLAGWVVGTDGVAGADLLRNSAGAPARIAARASWPAIFLNVVSVRDVVVVVFMGYLNLCVGYGTCLLLAVL
jgi:hypothetical protein